MNDLAKILGISDAKVKLKSINDHVISAELSLPDDNPVYTLKKLWRI